jgi:hypothetical protein
MADNFCSHCGNRLTGATNFCVKCGVPVGGKVEPEGRSPVSSAQVFERLGIRVRSLAASRPPGGPPGTPTPRVSAGKETNRLVLQRVWEPNEHAFTVLVPMGWKMRGGIFNVDPLQTNGPGNTISPKCDFAVESDDQGTIMIRWMPSWNYADLTFAGMGGGFFQPGQWYQGMPVRLMVSAKQFLYEMLGAEHPKGSDLSILEEDPMAEVTAAFNKAAEETNRALQQMGIGPLRFESMALMVEYMEEGQRYREWLTTTIADNRCGAFMWTNDNTIMFRAPAGTFDSWTRVLNKIQTSREVNLEWLKAVEAARGLRAKAAWLTQQYINHVASEILANHQKTNAELIPTQEPGGGQEHGNGGGDGQEQDGEGEDSQ